MMYGWSKDEMGKVLNYHRVLVCNTLTGSSAASGTQRPIIAVVYENDSL